MSSEAEYPPARALTRLAPTQRVSSRAALLASGQVGSVWPPLAAVFARLACRAMGYGKSNGWTRKKKRPLPEDGDEEAARAPVASEDVPSQMAAQRLTSEQRYTLFAHLTWLTCYTAVYAAEAASNAPLVSELGERFASAYMRQQWPRIQKVLKPQHSPSGFRITLASYGGSQTSATSHSHRLLRQWPFWRHIHRGQFGTPSSEHGASSTGHLQ